MVGVGAIAGTLSGGYTNAARSPDGSNGVAVDHAPVSSPVLARVVPQAPAESSSSTTTVAMTMIAAAQAAPAPAADEPAPTAVIAARFPRKLAAGRARLERRQRSAAADDGLCG